MTYRNSRKKYWLLLPKHNAGADTTCARCDQQFDGQAYRVKTDILDLAPVCHGCARAAIKLGLWAEIEKPVDK